MPTVLPDRIRAAASSALITLLLNSAQAMRDELIMISDCGGLVLWPAGRRRASRVLAVMRRTGH
jgi:hypothetical protein